MFSTMLCVSRFEFGQKGTRKFVLCTLEFLAKGIYNLEKISCIGPRLFLFLMTSSCGVPFVFYSFFYYPTKNHTSLQRQIRKPHRNLKIVILNIFWGLFQSSREQHLYNFVQVWFQVIRRELCLICFIYALVFLFYEQYFFMRHVRFTPYKCYLQDY